jgi:Uma2 family endonuclease
MGEAPRIRHEDDLRRYADQLLETQRVEYVDEGVLLMMAPAGKQHRKVLRSMLRTIHHAFDAGLTSVDWAVDAENYQWNVPGSRRFFVPDLTVFHPEVDDESEESEREAIALIVEITSPKSPNTVMNDRETKPREYAKGGVPLYLLVDQERATWTLHALAPGWQRYQIAADGKYGDPIPLPEPFGFSVPTDEWPLYPR